MAVCMDVMDRPWQWGVADCCTSACDVFHRLHGIDPMQSLRGSYSTRTGAVRAITSRGGWVKMSGDLARDAGLVEGTGVAGEIGLVMSEGQLCLAVSTGAVWIGKSMTGLASVSVCERSWRAA